MGYLRRVSAAWTLGIVLFAAHLDAQTLEQQSVSRKRWIISAVVLVAANFADGLSSRGAHELNPLLRTPGGTFSGRRAIAIKSGATGGALALQWLLLRRDPTASALDTATIANLGAAGTMSALAIRNLSAERDGSRTAPR